MIKDYLEYGDITRIAEKTNLHRNTVNLYLQELELMHGLESTKLEEDMRAVLLAANELIAENAKALENASRVQANRARSMRKFLNNAAALA
jgi:hypothetical protein